MTTQPRLNEDAALVSIILPPVFAGPNATVARINPSAELEQELRNGMTTILAYGLNGRVRNGEIVGMTVGTVKAALRAGADGFVVMRRPDAQIAFVLDLKSRWNLAGFIDNGKRF